ncbi:MAG: pantetheine-phosphate adenylyltransferase [Planctomycetota bacterium]
MASAIYPGSFDPVTHGHLDLIRRGSRLFTRLRVLVAVNSRKQPFFSGEERVELIRAEVGDLDNVDVDQAEGLVVEYAKREGFDTLLRGVRTTTDFNAEFQMALTNRSLSPTIETVFVMPSHEWSYLSSSLIREVVLSGGDVSKYVPGSVAEALLKKLA